jgi:hypothetical protein
MITVMTFHIGVSSQKSRRLCGISFSTAAGNIERVARAIRTDGSNREFAAGSLLCPTERIFFDQFGVSHFLGMNGSGGAGK